MSANTETKFNQSEAVTRCRGIKESKLKGQYALAKLVDEEVTIHSANLDEGRNQLMTQQFEQRSFDKRQEAEAEEFRTGRDRKNQFTALVDKLSALKLVLRFQEDNRETETAFKLSIRHKRAAFQVQLARLEKRQVAERNELMAAQTRLAQTAARIRAIEVSNMKDQKLARQLKKKHAIMDQQTQMKQQKESQFLREVQLCKTKQLQQLTELDIQNAEELQEIMAAQKAEEFELLAKHKVIEAQNEAALDKQIAEVQSLHLIERQKIIKIQLQRAQKKQAAELEKAQKSAARLREKVMLAENPVIKGSRGLNSDDDGNSTAESSRSQSVASSSMNESTTEGDGEEDTVEDAGDASALAAAKQNKQSNKGSTMVTDEEKELQAMMEMGREKNRNVINHHKNILKELKSQQKAQTNMKIRDQKRKVAELMKEHQEEMETLKAEQDQIMAELLANQAQNMNEDSGDNDNTSGLIVALMPDHIRADLNSGMTPEPAHFDACTMICLEISGFSDVCAAAGPENAFTFMRSVEDKIEKTVAKYPEMFKVSFEKGVCLIASGLSKENMVGTGHCATMTANCLEFVQTLQSAVCEVTCPGVPSFEVKAGVHTGPVTGGLIGTTYASYHLMGAACTVARFLASTCEPGQIQISNECKDCVNEADYNFEERGNMDVDGVGKVNAFWMK